MKPVYVSLGVGQEFNLAGLVKKIKVRKAIGPVILKTASETAPADLGETITFEKASDQVQVINAHDATNTLELIVISSEEGALDAAASSVAVSNASDLGKSIASAKAYALPSMDGVTFDTKSETKAAATTRTVNSVLTGQTIEPENVFLVKMAAIECISSNPAAYISVADYAHVGALSTNGGDGHGLRLYPGEKLYLTASDNFNGLMITQQIDAGYYAEVHWCKWPLAQISEV